MTFTKEQLQARRADNIRRTARLREASAPNMGPEISPTLPAHMRERMMRMKRNLARVERLLAEGVADKVEAGHFIEETVYRGLIKLSLDTAQASDEYRNHLAAFQRGEDEAEQQWAQEDAQEAAQETDVPRGEISDYKPLQTPEKKTGFWEKLRR